MKQSQAVGDKPEKLQVLASRFREERKRLGMSHPDVAHYCGVSVSSVFSWEAGRARIPLAAAVCLWEHGFDPNYLVAGEIRLETVQLMHEGEVHGEDKSACLVPVHLLLRHKQDKLTSFAYHNNAFYDGVASVGDILLFGALDNNSIDNINSQTIVLYRPFKSNKKDFLCKIKKVDSSLVHLENCNVAATVRKQSVLNQGSFIGKYCCRLETRQPKTASNENHNQRLKSFLKFLGTIS